MTNLLPTILFSLWFLLPIGIANMTPIFLIKIPLVKKHIFPLDFFKTFHKKRIFGEHKSVQGFVGGIIAAILVVFLQRYFYSSSTFLQHISPFSYMQINPIILGFLAGFGALGGDSLKSFFKRQIGIPPGKSFFPFDQIDYIFGAILTTFFYVHFSTVVCIELMIEAGLLSLLFSFFGFILHLKEAVI